ncbi:MAG: nitroreductase family protein [Dehalococcoidales bacterium]|nr:nitroreductase family protein [Dehalococcoidales bacterium]
MNETLKVINHRRSIRSYKPEQLKDEDVKTIVEAGVYAPTAMNQQKWHFTVVQNKTMLDKMMDTVRGNIAKSEIPGLAERAGTPDFNVYYNAPTVIIVTISEEARWADFDCGAAAENIALAAESLGIGSVMLGMGAFACEGEKGAALMKELGIPAGYRHVISISLGYQTDPNPPVPPRNMDVINYVK